MLEFRQSWLLASFRCACSLFGLRDVVAIPTVLDDGVLCSALSCLQSTNRGCQLSRTVNVLESISPSALMLRQWISCGARQPFSITRASPGIVPGVSLSSLIPFFIFQLYSLSSPV